MERIRGYEHSRVEKQKRKVGLLREYLSARQSAGVEKPSGDTYETEYQRAYGTASPARILRPLETNRPSRLASQGKDKAEFSNSSKPSNQYAWLEQL